MSSVFHQIFACPLPINKRRHPKGAEPERPNGGAGPEEEPGPDADADADADAPSSPGGTSAVGESEEALPAPSDALLDFYDELGSGRPYPARGADCLLLARFLDEASLASTISSDKLGNSLMFLSSVLKL